MLINLSYKCQAAADMPIPDACITPKVVEEGAWPEWCPRMLNLIWHIPLVDSRCFCLGPTLLSATVETSGYHPLCYKFEQVQVSMALPRASSTFFSPHNASNSLITSFSHDSPLAPTDFAGPFISLGLIQYVEKKIRMSVS